MTRGSPRPYSDCPVNRVGSLGLAFFCFSSCVQLKVRLLPTTRLTNILGKLKFQSSPNPPTWQTPGAWNESLEPQDIHSSIALGWVQAFGSDLSGQLLGLFRRIHRITVLFGSTATGKTVVRIGGPGNRWCY